MADKHAELHQLVFREFAAELFPDFVAHFVVRDQFVSSLHQGACARTPQRRRCVGKRANFFFGQAQIAGHVRVVRPFIHTPEAPDSAQDDAFLVGAFNAALAVGISGIPRFARVVRSATLTLVGREFVESARAVGASQTRILRRHLLPNLMPTVIVLASLDLGTAILSTATLSFLGLGAQPPTSEWGAMLNAGREFMRYAPSTMIFPGLALFLAVMSVNLVGDRLSHVLDPRASGRV